MLIGNFICLTASAEWCVHATFAAHREPMLVREVLEYLAGERWEELRGEGLRELGAIALAQRIRAATGGQFVLQLMNVREPI